MKRSILFWLAGAVLGGVSCSSDDVEGPAKADAPAGAASAVATTQALAFTQVSAGNEHTCGVATDHRAYCWGKNYSGELGDGTSGYGLLRVIPVAVAGGHQFRQVSAGYDHTCGITTDYRAYCWGGNYAAQLGDGTTSNHPTPVLVAGGHQFRQVDAGSFAHTCGVTYPDRRVYCWGNNLYGQLGDGTVTQRLTPVPVISNRQFRQVSAGSDHTCGVTTGDEAFCWGSNDYGQVGDGSTVIRRRQPALVAGAHAFHQIDAAFYHTCAVTTNDRAFCWGYGGSGEIGDGKTFQRFTPRAVAGGILFARLTSGHTHTCGETLENQAYCWGGNSSGQLGDGTTTQRLTPVAVAGGGFFAQVSAGNFHTCGVTPAAVASCWGANAHGELGDGTTTNRSKPVAVAGPM